MKHPALLSSFLLLFFFVISACSTTEPVQSTVFNFEYDGEMYQIVGHQASDELAEGINDFVKRENGYIIFWYRDINQDGFLNAEILNGIGLDRANQIYLAGIAAAMESGRLVDRVYERKYELTIGYVDYQVISLSVHSPQTYNIFIIRDRKTRESWTIRDLNRNGQLDDPLIEQAVRMKYQEWYNIVLQEGIEAGRIDFDGEFYLVERDPAQLAAAD
ncbi:MAG: hypothetical protein LAT84_02010 [Balneolia bacterium]|nr:hypothetical protein [Balneolia bacterium]